MKSGPLLYERKTWLDGNLQVPRLQNPQFLLVFVLNCPEEAGRKTLQPVFAAACPLPRGPALAAHDVAWKELEPTLAACKVPFQPPFNEIVSRMHLLTGFTVLWPFVAINASHGTVACHDCKYVNSCTPPCCSMSFAHD